MTHEIVKSHGRQFAWLAFGLTILLMSCSPASPQKTVRTWTDYGPSSDPLWKSPALCDLGANATSFASLDEMPKALTDDFLASFRRPGPLDDYHPFPIVGRNHPFDATDVVGEWPSDRRFIQGGRLGNRWFIWYEQGGFGYHQPILAYELDNPEGELKVLGVVPHWSTATRIMARGERSCEILRDYLNRRGPEPMVKPLVSIFPQ